MARLNVLSLHSPFPLRHTFCDSLVAYVWFFTLLTCFPHTVFYFFKWKMKIGWHFIWHLSDSRDVLETSKTIFGGRGSAEWMRLASLSFSQVSFLLLLFAYLRPWFLHRSLGSRICFSLIKTVQRKGSLKSPSWIFFSKVKSKQFNHSVNQ